MNLVIEYLLRGSKLRHLLTVPCCLMLEKGNERLAVTIDTHRRDKNYFAVRHWNLLNQNSPLPSFVEYKITSEELFDSDITIVPNYSLLKFTEEVYSSTERQESNSSLGSLQELNYMSCLEKFLNPSTHQNYKVNWLWKTFENLHVPDNLKMQLSVDNQTSLSIQRTVVCSIVPKVWSKWLIWRKTFIDLPMEVAPELVFAPEYNKAA